MTTDIAVLPKTATVADLEEVRAANVTPFYI